MGEYTLEDKRKENANAYYPWSKMEEELLIRLLKERKSIGEISLELKRGSGAIISRMQKLGYKFEKDNSENYWEIASRAKDYLNEILVDEKITYSQIAELIKELINAIQEPKMSSEGIPDDKDNIETDDYDVFPEYGSGSNKKYNHPEYDDDTIDSAFEGDPSLAWNID